MIGRPTGRWMGVPLVILAALIAGGFSGWPGAFAAGGFGLLASLIQLAAGHLMAGQREASLQQFLKRCGAGMGLRLLGVVIVGVVVWLEPEALPPVPAALGYIGVLIPLLFLEARRI
ncbi:MAG TPA: hypothetical protein VGA78_11570 [Gemmatimonadales bacterium]